MVQRAYRHFHEEDGAAGLGGCEVKIVNEIAKRIPAILMGTCVAAFSHAYPVCSGGTHDRIPLMDTPAKAGSQETQRQQNIRDIWCIGLLDSRFRGNDGW